MTTTIAWARRGIIASLLLLCSCASTTEDYERWRSDLEARGRAERQLEEAARQASTRPLTAKERSRVLAQVGMEARDPNETRVHFDRPVTFLWQGHRVVVFLMRGVNAFGGHTGWQRYMASFQGNKVVITRGQPL